LTSDVLTNLYNGNPNMKIRTILLLSLLFFTGIANAASVIVNWSNPTQNEDGTPVGTITGTRVEWGSCTATDSFNVRAGELLTSGPVTTATIPGLASATKYCIRAYTIAGAGNESRASNTIARTTEPTRPNPPTISSVVNVVWELKQRGWKTTVKYAGTTPIGTPCYADTYEVNGVTYNGVNRSYATITKGNPKILVSICG
jgi:hypothetical protein